MYKQVRGSSKGDIVVNGIELSGDLKNLETIQVTLVWCFNHLIYFHICQS